MTPNNIFLRVLELSQEREPDRAIRLFVEALASAYPDLGFCHVHTPPATPNPGSVISVAQPSSLFGWVVISGKGAPAVESFIRNAFSMLAVILESRHEYEGLTSEKEALQQDVETRTRSLEVMNRELVESRERFRTLVETISDWIWEVDAEGRYTYVSPRVRDVLGYDPASLIGQRCYDLMPPDEAEKISAQFSEYVSQGKAFKGLINVNLHQDGHRVIIETTGQPFFDQAGRVAGYRGVDRDVTERMQAAAAEKTLWDRLAAAERMETVGLLAGGVAHDLNNALGPLVVMPDLVEDDIAALEALVGSHDAGLHESLSVIKESALRASRIVKDLVALGRRGRYERLPFDLNRLPDIVIGSMRNDSTLNLDSLAAVRSLTQTEPLMVHADECALVRIGSNLLRNAVEAVGEGGRVTVVTMSKHVTGPLRACHEWIPPGDYAVLRFSDTGRGISREDQERVLEPFFSKDGQGARRNGRGLGLAVVHGMVKDHDGYIRVVSDGSTGTSFEIYLALFGAAAEKHTPAAAAETTRGGGDIFIVDDESAQRHMVKAILEKVGYRVTGLASGNEAVVRLREARGRGRGAPCALVILDMVMEDGFDGLDMQKAILTAYPELPVIVASGNGGGGRVAEAVALGAVLLPKPYESAALIETVQHCLSCTADAAQD